MSFPSFTQIPPRVVFTKFLLYNTDNHRKIIAYLLYARLWVKSFCVLISFDPGSILIKYEALLPEVQGGPENGKSRFESCVVYPTHNLYS